MNKFDLKINHITKSNYVEFSFAIPFGDLFYQSWSDLDWIKDGKEIEDISDTLSIPLNFRYLDLKFGNNYMNVEVFHNPANFEEFISIDFDNDPTDQCGMVILGVRCLKTKEIEVRDKLFELYKKGNTRSVFTIDYFNQFLYSRTFNSEFYFYNLQENNKRKLNHHNIN